MKYKGLTLVELLISICIFALIIFAFSNIDTFSRQLVLSSDRKVKLQSETSYILEHIAKNLTGTDARGGAIGDINYPAVTYTNIGGDYSIAVQVDYNNNGKWDGEPTDKKIVYQLDSATHAFWYYPNFTDFSVDYEVLNGTNPATGISYIMDNFSSYTTYPTYCVVDPAKDYIDVQVRACWDPSLANCGTIDNPQVTLRNRIYMPSVSAN